MRPRVYISGPLTSSGDVTDNIEAAIAAARELIAAGFAPLVPHLSYYVDPEETRFGHDTWLEVDLSWVETAHAVLRLPGESTGADKEVARATAMGIPVLHSTEEFADALKDTKSWETFRRFKATVGQ